MVLAADGVSRAVSRFFRASPSARKRVKGPDHDERSCISPGNDWIAVENDDFVCEFAIVQYLPTVAVKLIFSSGAFAPPATMTRMP